MGRVWAAAAAGLAVVVLTSGCSTSGEPTGPASTATGPGAGYPVTVQTCDTEITLEREPERVMFMGATGVAAMHELGVLDKTVVYSGNIDLSVFDPAVAEHVQSITKLEGEKTETGGAKISTESILEQRVDLIVGYDSGADRDALAKSGVPLYTPDAFCPDYELDKANFELVFAEVSKIAELFGVPDRAAQVNDELAQQIPQPSGATGETAAALYITPGVEKMWAYGPPSMVQPILESTGLTNAYADQTERVPRGFGGGRDRTKSEVADHPARRGGPGGR